MVKQSLVSFRKESSINIFAQLRSFTLSLFAIAREQKEFGGCRILYKGQGILQSSNDKYGDKLLYSTSVTLEVYVASVKLWPLVISHRATISALRFTTVPVHV